MYLNINNDMTFSLFLSLFEFNYFKSTIEIEMNLIWFDLIWPDNLFIVCNSTQLRIDDFLFLGHCYSFRCLYIYSIFEVYLTNLDHRLYSWFWHFYLYYSTIKTKYIFRIESIYYINKKRSKKDLKKSSI